MRHSPSAAAARASQDGTFVRKEKQEEKTIVELRKSLRTTATLGGGRGFTHRGGMTAPSREKGVTLPAEEDEEDEDEGFDEGEELDEEEAADEAAYAAERRAAAAAAEPPAKRHKPEEVEEAGAAAAGPRVAEEEVDEGLFDDEDEL